LRIELEAEGGTGTKTGWNCISMQQYLLIINIKLNYLLPIPETRGLEPAILVFEVYFYFY
jgi:hypothetical protein